MPDEISVDVAIVGGGIGGAGVAAAIAADLDHSVYDCIFLVCAKRQSIPFVIADRKLLAKISGLPQWRNVQSLSF